MNSDHTDQTLTRLQSYNLQPRKKPGTIIAETLQCLHCSECIVLSQVDCGDPMNQDLDYPFGSSKIWTKKLDTHLKFNSSPLKIIETLPSQKGKESSSNPQCFRCELWNFWTKKTHQKLHCNCWWFRNLASVKQKGSLSHCLPAILLKTQVGGIFFQISTSNHPTGPGPVLLDSFRLETGANPWAHQRHPFTLLRRCNCNWAGQGGGQVSVILPETKQLSSSRQVRFFRFAETKLVGEWTNKSSDIPFLKLAVRTSKLMLGRWNFFLKWPVFKAFAVGLWEGIEHWHQVLGRLRPFVNKRILKQTPLQISSRKNLWMVINPWIITNLQKQYETIHHQCI